MKNVTKSLKNMTKSLRIVKITPEDDPVNEITDKRKICINAIQQRLPAELLSAVVVSDVGGRVEHLFVGVLEPGVAQHAGSAQSTTGILQKEK